MSEVQGEIASAAPVVEPDDAGEWHRMHPLSMLVHAAHGAVRGILPGIAGLIGLVNSGGIGGLLLLPLLLGALAIGGVAAWLGWHRRRYRIGAHDIRLEHGVLSRSARSVPYDRIQDVSLEAKLLPRLLGLVEVRFETGAGGKDELTLAHVGKAEGERLRKTVRAMADGTAPMLPGDSADPAAPATEAVPARVLFAMGPRRLFTYGLFSFSLVIFAVLLGAAQQLGDLLPFDIWDSLDRWVENEGYVAARDSLGSYDASDAILAALSAVLTIVVVGMASGVVTVLARDWGFLLERTAKGFRRRRGLFTKTDVVMPVHRVQALVIGTGWLRRRFGWHGLSVISLAQDAGKANHEVAPFATMTEIAPIVSEAGFALPDEAIAWCRPSPAFFAVRGLVGLVLLALPVAAGAIAAREAAVLWLLLPLAIWQGLRGWYLWHAARHAIDARQVVTRHGWLAPRLQIADRVKLHSAAVVRGPLGRLLGYRDLVFGLAGGRLVLRGLRAQDAYCLRAAVLDSMASLDYSRLAR